MKGTAQVLFFQVITLLCNFSQLFLAQRLWGDQGLSLFTQWRRLSALLIPLMLLGHGIALARELGRAHDLPQKRVDIVASSFSFISTILLAVDYAICSAVFGLHSYGFPMEIYVIITSACICSISHLNSIAMPC